MFCPQCGQQQVSDEVRFCSRCGFQLEGVSGLLTTGGAIPLSVMQGEAAHETSRRKGARQGGKILLFGLFLMPALAVLHELLATPEELPLVGLIVFLGGLLRLIYALVFEEGPLRRQKTQPPFAYAPPNTPGRLGPQARGAGELPPPQAIPARGYVPPRANTSEIEYRPSVTEGTTRLLDDQQDTSAR